MNVILDSYLCNVFVTYEEKEKCVSDARFELATSRV